LADGLAAVLSRSRDLGFLGPGDPIAHVRHAQAFADAYEAHEGSWPPACCDLGAGGGVPGLVLALRWPETSMVLLEASSRRCAFLRESAGDLGCGPQVVVAEGRAEALAREPALEGRFTLVTSRSFGPPAATAECAARLLAPGGLLMVSEPPDPEAAPASRRWPEAGLTLLGLGPVASLRTDPHLVGIRRVAPCPERYPRRVGVPVKRPLF
jgi:16S rRNA (guanine527-N7)-methyltransferase